MPATAAEVLARLTWVCVLLPNCTMVLAPGVPPDQFPGLPKFASIVPSHTGSARPTPLKKKATPRLAIQRAR